jgi:putative peptidoglycan lipid II flippase
VREPRVRLVRSASVAGAATLASRLLGLARDQVLAALFGASHQMDAFVVASRIPNLVRDLFAEGAMSAAFVPTFATHLTRHGRPDAWRLGANVLNALLIVTAAVATAGIVFADPLVRLYAGDFAGVPGKLELTVLLTRIMLPFLTLAALAAAAMGMLNSLHHYFIPALAPATFNVATILCALLLVPLMPRLGWPEVTAIAIGTLLGGIAQVLTQWPALHREGFRHRLRLDVHDAGLRRVLLLMGPGTIGLAATQVNLFVNTQLAVGQGPGAPSWLAYAFRLMYLPIGLFGVSIATAVLPAAARDAAIADRAAVRRTISRGLSLMLLLNVPATVGLIALANPIVRVLFERGQFLPSDTAATAAVLQCYAIGLIGYAGARIASPVFYALGRHRLPIVVSTLAVVVNIAASVALVGVLGVSGLALGTSVAALTHGAAAVWLLRKQLGGLDGALIATAFSKVALASLAMGAIVVAVERWLHGIAPGAMLAAQAFRLTAAILAGLVTLAASCRALGVRELDEAVVRLRQFVRTA